MSKVLVTAFAFGLSSVINCTSSSSADVVRFSAGTGASDRSTQTAEATRNLFGAKVKGDGSIAFSRTSQARTRKLRLGAFQWQNCGSPSKELLVVPNLNILPDPIYFPGSVTVNATAMVNQTLDSSLQVELVILKDVFGSWLKVPCIDNVGSCTYTDLCPLLSGITCPPSFDQQKVPCKCPFSKGDYQLTNAAVALPNLDFVPVGDYRASATLTMNGQFVGCYNLTASLAD